MSTYLIINLSIFIVPFLMSFESKIKFYRNLPAFGLSILIVGGVYIVWDAYATIRGDWAFNNNHIAGLNIFYLPIEEILFFITVPYSALFLYETGKYYLNDKHLAVDKRIFILIIVFLIMTSAIFNSQYYTFTVLLFSAIFFFLAFYSQFSILNSQLYWIWIALMYIPFFIVNYVLTSLPVVLYSQNAIWGIRITTIPIEDFFYSFSLLSLNLLMYLYAKEKWLVKRK
jgi:lycopene cyclase domain-containing protein